MDVADFSIDTNVNVLPKLKKPFEKEEKVERVKITLEIPVSTKKIVKQALSNKFFGVYRTQNDLINEAILNFVK